MKIHRILKTSLLAALVAFQTMACTTATPAPSFDIGSTQTSEKDGLDTNEDFQRLMNNTDGR